MKKTAILMILAALLFAGCANDGDTGTNTGANTNTNTIVNNTNPNPDESGDSDAERYTLRFDENIPKGTSYGAKPEVSPAFPKSMTGTSEDSLTIPNCGYYLVFYNETQIFSYFSHWNTKSDGSGTSYTAGKAIKLTEDLTLYAIYKEENATTPPSTTESSVSLSFELDSKGYFEGTTSYGTKSITGKPGDAIPVDSIPKITAREGYEFAGWSPSIPDVFPAEKTTYTATFTPKTFSITYHLNGGTNDGSNPASYTYGASYIELANPSRAGYRFSRWSKENEDPIIHSVDTSTLESGKSKVYLSKSDYDLNLYAVWCPNRYKIVFSNCGYYAEVRSGESSLSFYKLQFDTLDYSMYTTLPHKYEAPVNTETVVYNGWVTHRINPYPEDETIVDEPLKLLDNDGKLLANVKGITDENGNWIASNNYSVIPDITKTPQLTGLFTIFNLYENKIRVSWDKPTTSEANSYTVKVTSLGTGSTTKEYECAATSDGTQNFSFDTERGVSYSVAVKGCYSGNYGPYGKTSYIDSEVSLGDILCTNGEVIQYDAKSKTFASGDGSDTPFAIIVNASGEIEVIGLYESEPLAWATNEETINNTLFGTARCTPTEAWGKIQEKDPAGAADAQTNYPIFHFANTYGSSHNLSGDNASGWYVFGTGISGASRVLVNMAIEKAGIGDKLEAHSYWTAAEYLPPDWYSEDYWGLIRYAYEFNSYDNSNISYHYNSKDLKRPVRAAKTIK